MSVKCDVELWNGFLRLRIRSYDDSYEHRNESVISIKEREFFEQLLSSQGGILSMYFVSYCNVLAIQCLQLQNCAVEAW